jgi:hypothetical protein
MSTSGAPKIGDNMNTLTLDACSTCNMFAAGYDAHEIGYTPEHAPLSKISYDMRVVNMDGEGFFSASPCHTCEDTLAGDRFTVAIVPVEYGNEDRGLDASYEDHWG